MKRLGILRLAHLWNDRSWAQISPQAACAADEGHLLSFDYLPRPVRSVALLDKRIAEVEPDIAEASLRHPGCHWSMKPEIWGLQSGLELFAQALSGLNVICHKYDVCLRMDTPPAPYQNACLEMALSLPGIQPILAVSVPGFNDLMRLCIGARRRFRLVKGYLEAHESEYTVSDRMAHAVLASWQAEMPAAIATHDMTLIQSIVEMPGYELGMLEVEMVAHLVIPHQVKTVCPERLRLYYPYGANAGRFFVKRVLGSPVNRHAVLRATQNR